ncbi:uncharacterized protein LOC126304987 [Schistocerca gregaria]|uniref:uncharacterized protein LOC126304987 n=1 Tax=Schistocerca gregaria TaxID=7010 RepID=UPI00211E5428|nr:uncharacterized protein LOC126304987 [Schistocerca gregaria]
MVVSSSESSPFLEQVEQSFYTNMVLLGFRADPVFRELGYTVSPSMFQAPNMKGMEGVLYFLLTKIRPELKQEWRAIWPILDKKQAREFKESAHKVLLELEKQGCFPTATIRFFHLHSCSGEKFCHMVWNLSTHALCSQSPGAEACPKLRGVPPASALNATQMEAQKRALGLGIYLTSMESLEVARRISESEKVWKSTARELEEDYRRVQSELSLIRSKHRELEKLLENEKGVEHVEKDVESNWDSILDFFESTKAQRGMIKDVLNRKSSTIVIQGSQFCEDDCKDRNEPGSLGSGEVDLKAVLNRWIDSAHPLLTELNRVYSLSSESKFEWLKKKKTEPSSASDQNALDQLLASLDGMLVQHGHHLNHTRSLIEQLELELASDDAIISRLEADLVAPPPPPPQLHEKRVSNASQSRPVPKCDPPPLNCDALVSSYSNHIRAKTNSRPTTPLLDANADRHPLFDWTGLSSSASPLDLLLSPDTARSLQST